jgi:hypothetical protein
MTPKGFRPAIIPCLARPLRLEDGGRRATGEGRHPARTGPGDAGSGCGGSH